MNLYKENYEKIYHEFLSHTTHDKFKVTIYNKGDYLISSGDELDSLYFVLSGKIRIFQDYENGKRLLIRIFDPFTILGDIEYFLKQTAMCSVQAIEEVSVLKVPYNYIDFEYKNDLTFLNNVLLQMSTKILFTNEQALLNNVYTLDTRLASYLLSMCNCKTNFVELPSLSDIANHLGTSYRHLTRTIKNMGEKGVIKKMGRKMMILNKALLEEISKGNVYEGQSKDYIKG